MTPTLPPFLRPCSLHLPTFCRMLCDPSVFYRIWFWPSADAESTKPDHDEKSLHRHTIPCFTSSRSPFELQLGSRETPHASHPETEEERCLRRNQRRAARAVWVRCEPSTPRRDPKTGELARRSRRRGFSLKVSVLARLEFELTYYSVGAQLVSHYAMKNSP